MRAASDDRERLEVRGPAPLQRLARLHHFERVADRAPERRVHRRHQRLGPDAGRLAHVHERPRQRRARPPRVFMNAPRPIFTSSTSASMPSAIFLLMIDEVMSGTLSTVAVTSRSA